MYGRRRVGKTTILQEFAKRKNVIFDDVDLLALNKKKTEGLFCECKYTGRPMPMEEYDDLVMATKAFPEEMKKHLMFISRSGYTLPVQRRAREEGAILLTIDDLFS